MVDGVPAFSFLDHPGPIPFAHRGAHHEPDVTENSLTAFERAVALGYRYVETDVHATADGELVALHDERLDRVTDRTGAIAELPWREVRRARMANGDGVPLLEDLLGSFPQLRVNIDAKHDAAVGPLLEVLERTGAYDRVCLGAFSDARIVALRDATGGRVCTALGPIEVAALLGLADVDVPAPPGPAACAQVPVRHGDVTIVDERFVAAAHARGIAVHVWTVDDPAEMAVLLDMGVDGIMTDRPDLLREVLQSRGQWH